MWEAQQENTERGRNNQGSGISREGEKGVTGKAQGEVRGERGGEFSDLRERVRADSARHEDGIEVPFLLT